MAEELGNDLHAYNYIDTYIIDKNGKQQHQQTGHRVSLKDRPLDFWATLIQFNVKENDSLDVYIRLEGINLSYPPESFSLWHLDFDYLFSNQIISANKSSLFNGILGIQVLFFIFLFLIERELIYISFSVFGLGMLLVRAFTEFNFSSYVPFPSLTPYNEMLFHFSVFIAVIGGLFFLYQFFSVSKDNLIVKRVVPIYSVITLVSYVRYIFRYSFSETGHFPLLLTPAIYTFAGIFLSICMVFGNATSRDKSKAIFLFIVLLAVNGILILLNNEAHLTFTVNEIWLSEYINKKTIDDIFRVGVVILIATLSLNVGYRSLALKSEKEAAIQENLKAQQTIFEKQLRTEKLEELNTLKTKLYTNITHEFRTPLTVIMGINDELSNTTKKLNLPANKKEKILQNQKLIQRNSKNLLTLVNQLLDLSKSENQELELQLKQGDILSYLNYLTESFYSRANEKNIRLVFFSELASLNMDYDEQKIQHIVYNLLSNAIKFTPENGKIVMHASHDTINESPALRLVIKDNGIGIPSDNLPYIFDRFYQVDDTNTRHVDGSGIGLALTKDMVELMNGNISVESQLGLGSTFIIKIPITNQAEESDLINTFIPISVNENPEDISIPLENEEHTDTDQKPILLIVEDNKDVSIYLKLVLSQTYNVISAVNGEEGINKAKEAIPDLIISDVMMPIKDGFELTNTLKQDKTTSHIPIILLTAKATHSDKVEGLSIGADAYLTKPFDKQELLIRINKLIESRLAMQQHYSLTSYTSDSETNPKINSTIVAKEEPFITQIQSIIKAQLQHDNLNAESIAKEIGISQSKLYRKVKALTGLSINNYVRNFRLQQSLDLLQDTDKDIAEIAYEVGFNSPSYYSRSFTKVYKQSPMVFRKKAAL